MATLRSAACRREAPIRSPFRRPDESRDPSCRRHDAERQSHEVAASRNIGSAATPPHAAVLAAPWVPAFAGQTRRALRPERPLSSVARAPPNHHDRRRSLSPQLTAHLMTANQTCGQAAIALLEAHGVDTVFGIPGVHTLEFYRGLAGSRLRHVAVRHEQGAGFMADGYARVSGRPAVCLVITGPGLTNAATAIGQASSDPVPMLVLSSVNARDHLGNGLVPDDHPLSAGAALAFRSTQEAVAAADLAIVIGSELAETDYWTDRLTFGSRLLRIDIDAPTLTRDYPPTLGLQGDSGAVLAALLPQLAARPDQGAAQAMAARLRAQ